MKIALVSFEFWYNYGTCFQSYALAKAVSALGVRAEYLNFEWAYPVRGSDYLLNHWRYKRPALKPIEFVRYIYTRIRMWVHRDILKAIVKNRIKAANNRQFDGFLNKFIPVSDFYDVAHPDAVNEAYDLFVVGSDQTWNPNCVRRPLFGRFLLDFVTDNSKKASYAPSVGMTTLDEETKRLFKKHLSTFVMLSCREKTGCDLIREVTGKNVAHVLDPTFLLTPDEWRAVAATPVCGKGYVLCYILGSKLCVVEYAKELARRKGVRLIIVTNAKAIMDRYFENIASGIGPSEFLTLLDDAESVVTDSFHGTALSINFGKDIHVFMKKPGGVHVGDNSRIRDVLFHFGLESCFREDDADIRDDEIDWGKAQTILSRNREQSWEYLKSVVRLCDHHETH